VATGSTHALSVLLGNGDGTFLPPELYGAGLTGSQSLRLVDVDDDGALDAAVVSIEGNLLVFYGDGENGFEPAHLLTPPTFAPSSLHFGDFDGDGLVDLAGLGGYSVGLIHNQGGRK